MTAAGEQHQGVVVSGRFPELEEALCERIRQLRQHDPLRPLTIVVGSSSLRVHLADALVRGLEGVANVSIVTLFRFASRLVGSGRGLPPVAASNLVCERLVRRCVAQAPHLQYFGPVSERPHFAQALIRTFADLREALVDPAGEWAGCIATPGSGVAAAADRRSADLRGLYAAYCRELADRDLVDDAAAYAQAASAVTQLMPSATEAEGSAAAPSAQAKASAAVPPGTQSPGTAALVGHVMIYGLYDLNQAQEGLVTALLAAGADLFVPLPRDVPAQAARALTAAENAGKSTDRVAAPHAASDRDRIADLWGGSGARTASPLRLVGDGSLQVLSVPDERSEVREAARALLMCAGEGTPFRDCAVVVPHGEDVELMAAGLQALYIPVACRVTDRSPGSRVLLRLLDCLAPLAGLPFGRRAVVDLVTAGPLCDSTVRMQESALWLDEARQAGVLGGLDQWVERLGRRRRGLEARLAEMEAGDAEAAAFRGDDDEEGARTLRLRLAAARGLEVAVGALQRACRDFPDRASWGEWAAALGEAASRLFEPATAGAAADAAARLRALDILREEVDVGEMAAALREQLAGARAPLGRPGRSGVAVLTPLELRGLSFHTVVFTGLAEGGFPSPGRPDPILGDAERRRISQALGVRLPLAEERPQESLLLFAFGCEAARQRLYLVAPRADAATGRPRLPSRLLLRLASLSAGRPVGLEEFLTGEPLRPVWRHVGGAPRFAGGGSQVWLNARERDAAVLVALGESQDRGAVRSYAGAVLGDERVAARRLGAWDAARSPIPGTWDGLLGTAARAALAERHPFKAEMHPTRLERYVACPFAFYLRDVLGLEAPQEPDEGLEMQPVEFGDLVHRILQHAFERLIAQWDESGLAPRADSVSHGGAPAERGSSAPHASAVQGEPSAEADPSAPGTLRLRVEAARSAVSEAWRRDCAAAEARGVTGAPLAWNVRREMLLEDLLESTARDRVFARGDGRPVAVEWRFGEAAGRPVTLDLPNGRLVRFAGRLDRIDVTSAGARVIDYKTGSGGAEKKRLEAGLGVQLPVYRLAVRECMEGDYRVVECLYRLVTRRGGFMDLELADEEQASVGTLRALVSAVMDLVDGGFFPRTTHGSCDFCDVRYACGTSGWTRRRKRESELLADVVRLQRHAPEEVNTDAG